MVQTIRLYGELGEKFGREHKLHVDSPKEAIRALCANFKDFKKHLMDSEGRRIAYEVWNGKENVGDSPEEYKEFKGVFKIIPRVIGASTVARMVVGAVLIIIGAIIQYVSGGTLTPLAAYFYQAGVSMILMALVFPTAKQGGYVDSSVQADTKESYIFSGPVNAMGQGKPISVGYGEMIVGSHVISAAVTTSDIPV